MVKSPLNGNSIYLRLLSKKGCDFIRPVLHLFYFDDNFCRIAQWVLAFRLYSEELRIDRGSLRGALYFCTAFLNYDSCYSTLYIFWKVIFFSF